jgi:hypothetical protein
VSGSSVVFGDEKQEEVLLTRIRIINRGHLPVRVASKYRCLFHGGDMVPYGATTIRYPITNTWYQRLMGSLVKDYPGLKVDIGASGIELL